MNHVKVSPKVPQLFTTMTDQYEIFRDFIHSQEMQFASLINYFQDRHALEQNYAKDLDRLSKKYTLVFDANVA